MKEKLEKLKRELALLDKKRDDLQDQHKAVDEIFEDIIKNELGHKKENVNMAELLVLMGDKL